MKKTTQLIILTGLLLAYSCQNVDERFTNFPKPKKNKISLKYHSPKIETIILNDEGVESSQIGFSGIHRGQDYYFFDVRFCWYYVFDLDGNYKARFLGQGGGPREIPIGRVAGGCILQDSSLFLLGHTLDHYIFDKNFERKTMFFLSDYRQDINSGISDWWTYTHEYDDLIIRNNKDKIFFNMYMEHPNFIFFQYPQRYLDRYHIFEVDITHEKPGNMYLKGYPPVYHKNTSLSTFIFSKINYDMDNAGNFYVSFEADTLIYKYDNQFKPLYSFGHSGKNMDMNRKRISDVNEWVRNYQQERIDRGYYGWIEYVEETNLLFRSYKRGSHAPDDGLQIYSGTTLIADLSVPKGFRVAGYVAPYYYSHAIADEKRELLIVYRFKLE